MKKWTSLTPPDYEPRWRTLAEALQSSGCSNEFVPWQGPLNQDLKIQDLEIFNHVRISTRVAPYVMKQFKVQSSWARTLGVVDGMNFVDKNWWPQCALHECFVQQLIRFGQDLDMRANVLVAGAGGAARIAVAAFFRAGFRNFLLTNFDEPEAAKSIQEIKRSFFDLNIQWVAMEKIVLLPGESAVLINCTPSVEDNFLLLELSYLNFLKRPGFLFDLGYNAKVSGLVQEAKDAGVNVIDGVEMAARTDVIWAKWAFNFDLDFASYHERLKASLVSSK